MYLGLVLLSRFVLVFTGLTAYRFLKGNAVFLLSASAELATLQPEEDIIIPIMSAWLNAVSG